MAESQIDMTPECLVGWRVFRKPSNVTEDGVPAACMWWESWDPTPDLDRTCVLRPRSQSSWC